MLISTTQQCPQVFFLLIGVLLVLQPKYYGFSESVSNIYYRNASGGVFRFRDFEPRSLNFDTKGQAYATTTGTPVGLRQARGFLLQADRDDLKVDIEFVVPFVRIPIERSMNLTKHTFSSLAHLNTGPLLLTGLFVAVGAAATGLFKVFSTTPVLPGLGFAHKKSSRDSDAVTNLMDVFNLVTHKKTKNGSNVGRMVTNMNELMKIFESKFRDNDIDLRSCVQKSICQYVKTAALDVRLGKATGLDKIIDGVVSLDTLHDYLSGTAVHKAIDSGKSSMTCENVFSSCKWTQPSNKILELLINYFKSLKSG